jgi:hypothetical protein
MTDEKKLEVEHWLKIWKDAALQIDPKTAEVDWIYAQTLDPYGVDPDLPEEYRQVGRAYFARSPVNDVWVWFGDLPDATRDVLWDKHSSKLAFPAGLEELIAKAGEAEQESPHG